MNRADTRSERKQVLKCPFARQVQQQLVAAPFLKSSEDFLRSLNSEQVSVTVRAPRASPVTDHQSGLTHRKCRHDKVCQRGPGTPYLEAAELDTVAKAPPKDVVASSNSSRISKCGPRFTSWVTWREWLQAAALGWRWEPKGSSAFVTECQHVAAQKLTSSMGPWELLSLPAVTKQPKRDHQHRECKQSSGAVAQQDFRGKHLARENARAKARGQLFELLQMVSFVACQCRTFAGLQMQTWGSVRGSGPTSPDCCASSSRLAATGAAHRHFGRRCFLLGPPQCGNCPGICTVLLLEFSALSLGVLYVLC